MRTSLFALLPLVTLVGCFSKTLPDTTTTTTPTKPAESTTAYEVADMAPSLSAQSDGGHIRVYAALFGKSGAFLELAATDTLTATVGSETHRLLEVKEGNAIHYEADFAQPALAVAATISFVRADGRHGGESQVMVPAPFAMTLSPAPAVSHTGTLAIDVPGLGASGTESLEIELNGVCLKNGKQSAIVSVRSEKALLDMSVVPLADATAPECDVEMGVKAQNAGQVDPAFRHDVLVTEFQGVQRRVATTHLTK